MSPTPQAPAQTPKPTPKPTPQDNAMPSTAELSQIAAKSLQIGAVTGTMGMLVGAGSGIIRQAPPTLFAIFAGLQWFALGSSYMASRNLLYHAWGGEQALTPTDKIKASMASGGIAGTIGGLFRGPRNILPGMIFFSLLGGSSTFVSQRWKSQEPKEKTSWLASEWSPLKPLSNEDYEKILEEKLLRVRAEIAIIEDNIAAIRASSDPKLKTKDEPTTSKKA